MKRFVAVFLACLLIVPAACADLLTDFNSYREMYTLEELEPFSPLVYRTGGVFISVSDGIELRSPVESLPDLLAAACCVLRCVDPTGSMIDQYGRLLHAYFMAREGGEKRATTQSGVLIYVSIVSEKVYIRLVV